MNQAQRKFLIDKIEKSVNAQIEELKKDIPEQPNLNKIFYAEAMLGQLKIKSQEEISAAIKEMAMNAKARQNWLTGESSYSYDDHPREIKFRVSDILILPESYIAARDKYQAKKNEINQKIAAINRQAETLIIRIQLASDKTLEKMINEVDDMGDISLMDTKIKYLNA